MHFYSQMLSFSSSVLGFFNFERIKVKNLVRFKFLILFVNLKIIFRTDIIETNLLLKYSIPLIAVNCLKDAPSPLLSSVVHIIFLFLVFLYVCPKHFYLRWIIVIKILINKLHTFKICQTFSLCLFPLNFLLF